MSRHVIRLSAVLALSLAASFSFMSSSISAKITLVNYFRGWGDLNTMWQDVATAFEKKYSNIKVKIVNVAYGEYWDKLETMIAAGTPPDMVFMDSTRFPNFVRKRLMRDLTDLIRGDKSIKQKDFYPEALDLFSYRGHIYGLPNDIAIYCASYNKNLLSQTGLVEPTEDWTSDVFLDMAKKLTRDTNGDGRPETWGLNWYPWEQAIYANGGHIADNPDNPAKSVINSDVAIEALEWYASLYLRHKVMGGDFASGKAGLQVLGHWNVPDFAKQCKFKWDVVGLPKFQRKATLNFGSAFMIPANSKHPKEAWELVKFYAGVEAQRILAKGGFGTPALRTIGESDVYLNKRPPENQKAFTNAISYAVKRPFTGQWDLVEQTMNTEINKLIAGKNSARAIGDKLAVELTKIFQRDFAKAR